MDWVKVKAEDSLQAEIKPRIDESLTFLKDFVSTIDGMLAAFAASFQESRQSGEFSDIEKDLISLIARMSQAANTLNGISTLIKSRQTDNMTIIPDPYGPIATVLLDANLYIKDNIEDVIYGKHPVATAVANVNKALPTVKQAIADLEAAELPQGESVETVVEETTPYTQEQLSAMRNAFQDMMQEPELVIEELNIPGMDWFVKGHPAQRKVELIKKIRDWSKFLEDLPIKDRPKDWIKWMRKWDAIIKESPEEATISKLRSYEDEARGQVEEYLKSHPQQ